LTSKGIWSDSNYKDANPPGKIEYPSLEERARFERAAERMPDPSPPSETGKIEVVLYQLHKPIASRF
jgi:hypothetical protein